MKKIEAIIRREKLNDVKEALENADCPGMTVWQIEGYGKQRGVSDQFRGRQFKVDLLPKTKIEIIVNETQAARIVEVIAQAAATGHIGDGKIFVSDVQEAVRIRTAEKGEIALG